MKKCTRTKSGISLMILVITIIVMAILAGTVIIIISNTNVINEATKTRIRSDLSSLQDMVGSYVASNYMTIDRKKEYKLSDYGIYNDEYENITYIRNGRLYVASSASSDIQEIARELNMLKGIISSDIGRIDINDAKLTNIIIRGNSTQDGTPTPDSPIEIKSVGDKTKNLFKVDYKYTKAAYGIYVDYNDDGSIYIHGTATKNVSLYLTQTAFTLKAGTYTINSPTSDSLTYVLPGYKTSTFKLTEDMTATGVYINIKDGTTIDTVYYPQLEEGETSTSYEPYGYKIPVKISGKNLLNYNAVEDTNQYIIKTSGKTYTPSSTGGTWRVSDYIEVSPNTKYSFNEISATASAAGSAWYDENKNYISGFSATELANNGQIMTSPDNAKYLRHSFRIDGNYNSDWQNTIMISESDKLVPYENYIEPSITNVYLDEPLRKIGDYADYIDFASGKVVRNIKEYAFTGNENWGLIWTSGTTTIYRVKPLFSDSKSNSDKTIIGINSNKLEAVSYDGSGVTSVWNKRKDDNYKYLIAVDYYNNPCGTVYIKNIDYSSDETNFKKWLNDQYNSGAPVLVDYILSTPISQKISLPTTWSQSGTFYVTVMTSVKPSNLQVEYK